MVIQHGTREQFERVWVNVLNSQGATITTHHPVMRIDAAANVASVTAEAEAALANVAMGAASAAGACIGLADEDIPAEDVGLVQVYGYHASVRVASLNKAATTVNPGTPIGQVANSASIGVTSLALATRAIGTALDTIGTQHSAALVAEPAYASHVFLHAL